LDVKQYLNVAAEVKKAEKTLADTKKTLDWLMDKQTKPHYAGKVPEEVKEEDNARIAGLNVECETITASINNFKKMK
jgi:valyl-tRNA synthetase